MSKKLPFLAPRPDEKVIFSPVNRCIYCDEPGPYRDEHIVPKGLAGDWLVLPKASCNKCEKMTNSFEKPVLRKALVHMRNRINTPTRGKSGRPDTVPLNLTDKTPPGFPDIIRKVHSVPVSEYPFLYMSLRLTPPGILLGLSPTHQSEICATIATTGDSLNKYFDGDNQALYVAEIQPALYARMLAKIAYCFAVAHLGYGSFKSLILPFIEGKGDSLTYLVGGNYDIPPPEEQLHRLEIHCPDVGGVKYVMVTMRLFARLGTPLMHVVVGNIP